MNVDAIQEWSGESRSVASNPLVAAVTPLAGDAVIAALAGVHGSDEHQGGRISDAEHTACKGNLAVFERLAEDFESGAAKFRHFVEKEDAVVGEAEFTGTRDACAAASKADVADGVVGRAKGASIHEALALELAGSGVDACGFQRFFKGHGGKNGGDSSGEHAFAGAGRTDHQDVVSASGGNFESSFDRGLAGDLGKVDAGGIGSGGGGFGDMTEDEGRFCAFEDGDQVGEVFYGVDVDAADDAGLGSVDGGDDDAFKALLAGQYRE